MRRLTCTILLIALGACAKPPHTKRVSIAPETAPLVELFKAGGPVAIDDLIVEFGEPANSGCTHSDSTALVGCCHYSEDRTPTIVIDQNKWNALDAQDLHLGSQYVGVSKQLLIFHELGHCILKRGHREDVHARGIPASVMMGQTTSGYLPQLFGDYKTEYVNELFGRGNGPAPFGE